MDNKHRRGQGSIFYLNNLGSNPRAKNGDIKDPTPGGISTLTLQKIVLSPFYRSSPPNFSSPLPTRLFRIAVLQSSRAPVAHTAILPLVVDPCKLSFDL